MWRKIRISLLVLTLIGLLVVGTSIAYFSDDGNMGIAKFVTGTVQIEFQRKPKVDAASIYTEKQQVKWTITNTGNNDVYLRVKVIDETDTDDLKIEGDIVLETSGNDWVKGVDEYYYYTKPVKPEDHVDFCLEVFFDVWDTVKSFPINIEVEAVQTSNDAINQEWPDNPLK